MFELHQEELEKLRSHFGTSSWGGTRYTHMAFTEQGVTMLSSVLNSERAIEINIAIMRVFVRLREVIATHGEFSIKLSQLERHLQDHDQQIQTIFEAMRSNSHFGTITLWEQLPSRENSWQDATHTAFWLQVHFIMRIAGNASAYTGFMIVDL